MMKKDLIRSLILPISLRAKVYCDKTVAFITIVAFVVFLFNLHSLERKKIIFLLSIFTEEIKRI